MSIDKAAFSDPHIEKLRLRLNKTILAYGDFLHPEVIRASQELDQQLVRHFREQMTTSSYSRKGIGSY